MIRIHINESAYKVISENELRRPCFQDFYEDVMRFMHQVVTSDPIGTKSSDMMSSHGIDGAKMRKMLVDGGILTKKERIDEPFDEESGKQVSRYYVRYSYAKDVVKALKDKNRNSNPLKDRIRKIYNEYFT